MAIITIGIADLNVVKPPDSIITYALGSCIGICLYDKVNKIAGMAHIMLPLSTEAVGGIQNARKYADTGMLELIVLMEKAGAKKYNITAKIAGGAQMFALKETSTGMDIGLRNKVATKETLSKVGIKLIAEDCGLNFGRTVEFYAENGMLKIKTIAHGTKMI